MLLAAKPVEETTTEFVERSTEVRMERMSLLTYETNRLELWVVLGEAALLRVVGGAKMRRERYEEIIRRRAEGVNYSDKDTTAWSFERRFHALRAGALAPAETPQFLHPLLSG